MSRYLNVTGWLLASLVLTACPKIEVGPPPSDATGGDAGDTGDASDGSSENQAPVFDSDKVTRSVTENAELQVVLAVSDPDPGDLVIVKPIDTLPSSVDFNSATAILNWKPGYDVVSDDKESKLYTWRFEAQDKAGKKSGVLTLEVTVQNDFDKDGAGDAEDTDDDDDGVKDADELAGCTKNKDCDSDGVPDADDTCAKKNIGDEDKDKIDDACDSLIDNDGDEIANDVDNCKFKANKDQDDLDKDGQGDACDDDIDGDKTPNAQDCAPTDPTIFKSSVKEVEDPAKCDGLDNNCDGKTDEGFTDTDGDEQADCVDDNDDLDPIPDTEDNCPLIANLDQLDTDGDKAGDVCDTDDDGDGKLDAEDNCPLVKNPEQENSDGDALGDHCDACKDDPDNDIDGDTHCAGDDNCPALANEDQLDTDEDGLGDVCDDDDDNDTKPDAADNCPLIANVEQLDTDGDKSGDACDPDDDDDGKLDDEDNCPLVKNPEQEDIDKDGQGDACDDDKDNDGVVDTKDNCPLVKNASQTDTDGDLEGDACDLDDDGDEILDGVDNCPLLANPFQTDVDADKVGDGCDSLIAIPADVVGGGDAVLGAARSGTVALQFTGTAGTGLFVLQGADHALSAPAWTVGAAEPPFVGLGGEAYFSAVDIDGSIPFEQVVLGQKSDALPIGATIPSVPRLYDDPAGNTLAEVTVSSDTEWLYVIGDGVASLYKTVVQLVDSVDSTATRSADGTVYVPSLSVGSKYGLTAFTATAAKDLAVDATELSFEGSSLAPPHSPWFCIKPSATSPSQLTRFAGAVVTAELGLDGCPTDLPGESALARRNPREDGEGVLWITYLNKTGTYNVRRWDPAGTVGGTDALVSSPNPLATLLAGAERYAAHICGADCLGLDWYNPKSGSFQPTLAKKTDYFKARVATSPTGSVGVVYKQKNTGPSALLLAVAFRDELVKVGTLTLDAPTATPVVVPGSPFMTAEGVMWVHASINGKPTMYSVFADSADPNKLVGSMKFPTQGSDIVMTFGATTLLGVTGDEGIRAVYVLKGAEAIHLANTANLPDKLFPLGPNDGMVDGEPWIVYPTTAEGDYVVARYSGKLVPVLTGLTSQPTDAWISPETGRGWFVYEKDGMKHYASIEGGAVKDWMVGAGLSAVYFGRAGAPPGTPAVARPWGARYQVTTAEHWTWCELPPSESCWTMPSASPPSWWTAEPMPSGRVNAVYFDDGAAYLWRNIDDK